MKIVFFGNPQFAACSLEYLNKSKKITIESVITNPDKKMGRGLDKQSTDVKKVANKYSNNIIELHSFNNKEFVNNLKKINADLFIIVAFKYIPKAIFTIPKFGSINLHASLLPSYRGASPIQYAILNGENYTGLTTFFINNKIDTGDIILQKEIKINDTITYIDLYNKMSLLGGALLEQTILNIKNNRKDILVKQKNEKEYPKAPKITKNDYIILWSNSSMYIHNQIRALNYKGAYAKFNNYRIKFFETYFNLEYNDLSNGEFILHNDDMLIGTGKGVLIVKRVQLESKHKITAKEFYNSNYLKGKFEQFT